jgi:hypothetical protein
VSAAPQIVCWLLSEGQDQTGWTASCNPIPDGDEEVEAVVGEQAAGLFVGGRAGHVIRRAAQQLHNPRERVLVVVENENAISQLHGPLPWQRGLPEARRVPGWHGPVSEGITRVRRA